MLNFNHLIITFESTSDILFENVLEIKFQISKLCVQLSSVLQLETYLFFK
jgi:hypothetical protein